MKNIITILALVIAHSLYSQSISDSLLLYYPLDGNANDASGNGHTGIINATPTNDRFGNASSAYQFNGLNEFIDWPNSTDLKPEFPVSFSFWMKLDDLQGTNTNLFSTNRAPNGHSGVWMNLSTSGYLAINYGDATGSSSINRRTKVGATQLDINVWYHVVGIINDAQDMELYIDCVNDQGTYNGNGGNVIYTNDPGSIGRKESNYFKGSLDEFRYWNRELTLSDINQLCNERLAVTEETAINQNKVSVYPNPVSDIIKIKVANHSKIESITISDALGQVIHQQKYKPEISVAHFKTGIYFLHAIDQENNLIDVIKLVKN